MKKAVFAFAGFALALSSSVHASLIRSDTALVPGTFLYDFDAGVVSSVHADADIFWEQVDANTRRIRTDYALGTAKLFALDNTDFDSISEADLVGYAYTLDQIWGPPGGSLLDVGDVFAVKTSAGNYAKVLVTGYDTRLGRDFYDIHLQYQLFDGVPEANTVPEPGSLALLGLSFAALAATRRDGLLRLKRR